MSEFKLPHVEDLTTNSKLPGQLTEDMKAIECAINDIHGEIDKIHGEIDKLQDQMQSLQKQLNSSDINTEYITDTGVSSNVYDEVPTSVDIDDTVETDNDGLRILESKD